MKLRKTIVALAVAMALLLNSEVYSLILCVIGAAYGLGKFLAIVAEGGGLN